VLFLAAKPKNKNLKAGHKNGKQKKMKRKWPGTGNKESNALLRNSGSQKEVQERILEGQLCALGFYLLRDMER
jgi:hypothetical protein